MEGQRNSTHTETKRQREILRNGDRHTDRDREDERQTVCNTAKEKTRERPDGQCEGFMGISLNDLHSSQRMPQGLDPTKILIFSCTAPQS